MNILIIPAFFYTKKNPTQGSFFLEQAKALKKAGHNVTILYCDTYSLKTFFEYVMYEEKEYTTIDGIEIYRCKMFCPTKHWIYGYKEKFNNGILKLYKNLKEKKIDIIHAHCCVWAGYAAMNLSEEEHIPYIITEHATLFKLQREKIRKVYIELIQKIFSRATEVICVSNAFKSLLSEFRGDTKVIGNVVDCRFFKRKNVEKDENSFLFFTLCYMSTEEQLYKKGIDILIKSWSKYCKQETDVVLYIGGTGDAKTIVEKWIKEYHIEDSVVLLGALDREEVVHFMNQCDAFVLPSRYETFGVVYAEAMACGKPVIAVKNGGPDDFIEKTCGILINADVDELQQAMVDMKKNRMEYDGTYISNYIQERFDEDIISRELECIYQKAVRGKR